MSSGVSLYYPYIHISEEGWLKRSLLYWDRVRRIVPDGFEPSDDRDCYDAKQAELLVATWPTPYLAETRNDSALRSQRSRIRFQTVVRTPRKSFVSFRSLKSCKKNSPSNPRLSPAKWILPGWPGSTVRVSHTIRVWNKPFPENRATCDPPQSMCRCEGPLPTGGLLESDELPKR